MSSKAKFVHIVDMAGREWFLRVSDIVAVRRDSGNDAIVIFTRTAGSLLVGDEGSIDRVMYYVLGLLGPLPEAMRSGLRLGHGDGHARLTSH